MTPSQSIIREQLARIEAMQKELALMSRSLHIALGDVRPAPKVVEWSSGGKRRKIKVKNETKMPIM